MTRDEFLSGLARELQNLNESDRQDAMQYYTEYFDEAGPQREQQVIAELGTPRQLAAKIRAELAYRQSQENPQSARKGLHAVWIGIGACFAAPIAIPLAAALAVVMLALIIVLLALLFTFFAIGAGLAVGGVALVVGAVILLFVNPATALVMLGTALVLLGVGGLFFIPTLLFSRWSFRKLAAFINRKLHPGQAQA